MLRDPPFGEFDLLVVRGCWKSFAGRRTCRGRERRCSRCCDRADTGRLRGQAIPGGRERSWSRLLVRGTRQIDRFLRRSGRLELVERTETDTHVFTLYRAAGAD